jgi:predicted nucleotidyltransferase
MRRRSSPSVKVFYPKFSRESLVEAMRRSIPALAKELPIASVILFGSYARGRHTAASDVDLLVVYEDPARPDAYESVVESLRIPRLEPLAYSRGEFERLAKGNPSLLRSMLRDGVVLYGESPEALLARSSNQR